MTRWERQDIAEQDANMKAARQRREIVALPGPF
jgi:hypothetical protein